MPSVRRRPTSPLTRGVRAPGTRTPVRLSNRNEQANLNAQVRAAQPRRSVARTPNRGNNGGAPYPFREPAVADEPDFSRAGGGLPEGMQAQAPTLGTAPPTSSGEALRIDARNQYNSSVAGLNYAAYQAALQYGDPATLAQFNNLYGPTPDNPNSALNQILRAEQSGIQGVSDAALRNNTWVSSMRLGDQQRVSDEANRQRLSARDAWERARFDWNLGLSDAWAQLQRYRRQADDDEYAAWLASQPEPTGVVQGPTGQGKAPAPVRRKVVRSINRAWRRARRRGYGF